MLMSISIETESLFKSIRGRAVIRGISLKVRPGEIVSILGLNGAGKSTLLRLLVGLTTPTSGFARICGFDPLKEREAAMGCVGYVPDEPTFWQQLSGRRCIDFVGAMRGYLPGEVIRMSAPLIERFDLGKKLDDSPQTYSHGERKRLAIVLAVLHGPKAVVLDEPSSALDPEMLDRLDDLLRTLRNGGASVVIATHLVEQAQRLSDLVMIMSHGQTIATRSPAGAPAGAKDLREDFLDLVRALPVTGDRDAGERDAGERHD
jgi:ABC-2 type transport system ATP-binding protein